MLQRQMQEEVEGQLYKQFSTKLIYEKAYKELRELIVQTNQIFDVPFSENQRLFSSELNKKHNKGKEKRKLTRL